MQKPTTRSLVWVGAGVACLVIAILRVRQINSLQDQGYFDKYLDFARAASRGALDPHRLPDFSPGYAWLLTLLHGQLQWSVFELRALQIVSISVAALAVAWAAEKAGGGIAAVVAGGCVLASRGALVNATDFEPEAWILLLGAIGLAPLTRSRVSVIGSVAAGLAFGLSAAMRPSAVIAIGALLVWLAMNTRDWRRVACFATAAFVPLVLILAVNFRLTGTAVIMDPGTVFYEGMNPVATGYSGVQPRIVNDLEEGRGADALHITYRIVAARASGGALSTEASNRFWTRKAIAFVRTHPLSAIKLTARKIAAAVSSYDSWDLLTMVRKERELSVVAIPFGYVFALGMTGLWFGNRRRLAPAAIALLCAMAPMVVFYVTARQRNAAIPAAAILAGAAVSSAVHNRRAAIAAVAAIIAGALLTIETQAVAEDRHMWWPTQQEAILFDEVLRLERVHQWAHAEKILLHLDDQLYEPARRNRTASSVSYHLARARLRQKNPASVSFLLDRARVEAPGDSDVLALSAALAPASAPVFERELSLLHDPFTAELSRIRALLEVGRVAEARARTSRLTRTLPEWKRPADVVRTW